MTFCFVWIKYGDCSKFGISVRFPSKKRYAFLNFKNKTIDFSVCTRYYDYIRVTLHIVSGCSPECPFFIKEFL